MRSAAFRTGVRESFGVPGSAQIVIVDTTTIHSGIPLENASAPKPM